VSTRYYAKFLGNQQAKKILDHLEEDKELKPADIRLHVDEFRSALSELVGPSALHLESEIIERVNSRLRHDLPPSTPSSLADYLVTLTP
jgi:hypothetical protein